jgi:hypothetical protein
MDGIKKNQHYVWKKYLDPWSKNDCIWTFFKKSGKIDNPNLKKVTVERYFYRLNKFTSDEIIFLKKFIDATSHNSVKKLNHDFLEMFTITSVLNMQNEKEIEINLMEDANCIIENLGNSLLACRNITDIEKLVNQDGLYGAIMFICFQYFRTKNMKNSLLKEFNNDKHEALVKKAWNIISYIVATNKTSDIIFDKNLKFTFIENNSEIKFITGDQPVLNLIDDIKDKSGEVIGLELFYPITPKHALIIHLRTDQINQFENQIAEREKICYFNNKILENSDFFVFADNKEQLENIKRMTEK